MRDILKYIPTVNELYSGFLFVVISMAFYTGCSFGIKTPQSEIIWITIPQLDTWVCLIIFWFGIDKIFCKDKATLFLIDKLITPIIKPILTNIIGEERLKRS